GGAAEEGAVSRTRRLAGAGRRPVRAVHEPRRRLRAVRARGRPLRAGPALAVLRPRPRLADDARPEVRPAGNPDEFPDRRPAVEPGADRRAGAQAGPVPQARPEEPEDPAEAGDSRRPVPEAGRDIILGAARQRARCAQLFAVVPAGEVQ